MQTIFSSNHSPPPGGNNGPSQYVVEEFSAKQQCAIISLDDYLTI